MVKIITTLSLDILVWLLCIFLRLPTACRCCHDAFNLVQHGSALYSDLTRFIGFIGLSLYMAALTIYVWSPPLTICHGQNADVMHILALAFFSGAIVFTGFSIVPFLRKVLSRTASSYEQTTEADLSVTGDHASSSSTTHISLQTDDAVL